MKQQTAACHCGQLQVRCEGDPTQVVMCHCELCQRRTGTTYSLAALFERPKVTIDGETHVYQRTGEAGFVIEFHFCPTCGTTVYWVIPGLPTLSGQIVVAVGCLTDLRFPAPNVAVYGRRRHGWVHQPAGIPSYAGWMENGEVE